jgi:lipase chaperone LimK
MPMAEFGLTPAPRSAVAVADAIAPQIEIPAQAPLAPLQRAEVAANDLPIANPAVNNSLRDTAVDGEVSLNPDGSVRLNLELRRMFDYYLARSGEMPSAELIVWIDAQLNTRYTPAVAAQLKILLGRYRSYLRALNAEVPRLQLLAPRLRLQALTELRTRALGQAMAEAFFASEHAWDSFTQDRLDLARDQTITPKVRAQREQELLQRLPAELAHSYSEQRILDSKLTVNLPEAATDRFAARERLFGADAAGRFAALDQSQAAFDGRVRRYLSARDQQRAVSEPERASLRAQYFDANEAARVAALEAIGEEAVLLGGN